MPYPIGDVPSAKAPEMGEFRQILSQFQEVNARFNDLTMRLNKVGHCIKGTPNQKESQQPQPVTSDGNDFVNQIATCFRELNVYEQQIRSDIQKLESLVG